MRSPFKFLDAYTLQDKDNFFGRDQEVETIYSMVFQTSLMLVYGLSGTGKTSLIQCGLASRFDGPDWFPFFIRRQDDINASLHSALDQVMNADTSKSLTEKVSLLFRYYLRPVYLIFDQFEELFILGTEEEQQQFMQEIQQLITSELPCKVILVMREEYIGQLYSFERLVPSIFEFRMRVESMNTAKVKEVILASLEKFNVELEAPVDENCQLMIDSISAEKSGIQLPYLQVYMDMLYREDYLQTYPGQERGDSLPPLRFTREEIKKQGRIEDVLDKFIDIQEDQLQQKLQQEFPTIPAGAVREILDAFVTEEGTKRPLAYTRKNGQISIPVKTVFPLAKLDPQILSQSLETLEQNRILRFSGDQIELAHDSLAELIDQRRTDEQRQRNEIRKRILNGYLEYRQSGEYLSRKQLASYEDYLPELDLDTPVLQFVRESEEYQDRAEHEELERQQRELALAQQKLAAEQRAARRQRVFTTVIGIVALMAMGLGAWAVLESRNAKRANDELTQKVIDNDLQRGVSLKIEGKYPDAIAILQQTLSLPDLDNYPDKKRQITANLQQWVGLDSLMKKGDRLSLQEKNWLTALDSYQQAYALSPDTLIANRLNQMETKISDQVIDLKSRAVRIIQLDGCERAVCILQRVIFLAPGDSELKEQWESCRNSLGIRRFVTITEDCVPN